MAVKNIMTKILAGFAVFASTATVSMAQDVTLRLHQFLPPQANVPKLILDVWADNVEKDSGGQIKIDRYPSMQLGGRPPELIDQATNGVADIIWTVVGYTPGRFPTTEMFEMPFLMKDPQALSCAYWTMFDKHMKEKEFKDVHVLGTWVHGPGVIHTKDPVEQIADLNGMKIRGGSRTVNQMLDLVGATPVGMPVPAVTESLSKGVIDGSTIPWEVTTSLKVPELVEFHTEFKDVALYTLTFVFAMNKDKYESLTAEQKAAIDKNSGLDFSIAAAGIQADADAPARQIAVDNGNTITIISGSDIDPWRKAAQPVYDNWIAEMNKNGIDGQSLIDEAKATQDSCAEKLNG